MEYETCIDYLFHFECHFVNCNGSTANTHRTLSICCNCWSDINRITNYPLFVRISILSDRSAFNRRWLGIRCGRIGGIIGPLLGRALLALSLPFQQNFMVLAVPGLLAAIVVAFIHEKSPSRQVSGVPKLYKPAGDSCRKVKDTVTEMSNSFYSEKPILHGLF